MKEKEFNLSKKIVKHSDWEYNRIEDVREFIKRLKEGITKDNKRFPTVLWSEQVNKIIDRLVGDDLK